MLSRQRRSFRPTGTAPQSPRHGGDTEALIRLDDHTDGDRQNWSRTELARLYPVSTLQFDCLAGQRNSSESFHNEMKRTMPRIPAYGATGQTLNGPLRPSQAPR